MPIDVTPGGVSANSYMTIAAADVLATDDLGPEAAKWLSAGEDEKESALKRATREIDEYLRSGWTRYSTTQRLRFPRSVDLDADSEPIIPRGIELATYQQAIYVLKNASVLAAANTRRARNMQSASEPEISYSQSEGDDGTSILSGQALHYLSGFRVAPRSTRAGSVRSVRVSSGFMGGS
jgi:hypothetical protein